MPFGADQGFSGGTTFSNSNVITTPDVYNPAPAAVYQSERRGVFTYTMSGLTAGARYTVRLHFAEIVHNAAHQDANLIFGAVVDETYGERVSVTVIATGFDQRLVTRRREEQVVESPRDRDRDREEPPVPDRDSGDVLDIPDVEWPRLAGYFVCPSTDALYILAEDPS